MAEARFVIEDCPPEHVRRLRGELGVSAALAQVLVRRGLCDPARARAFLEADATHPASAFEGIDDATRLILAHVRAGKRITVHGDYDVDGVCSTAVLVRALRRMGADVDWYLPDRADDGYGLSERAVRRLAERRTSLLVTADCAITAVEEVALATRLGIEVVVTDHHRRRADGVLPEAVIVHPDVCRYPCPQLCATAVAYKLADALLDAACAAGAHVGAHERRLLEADLDLVALASVADVVSLVDENRTLVRRGLRALAGTTKPGLRALMAVSGVDAGRVDERSVGFALAPRLNAAGRLRRADAALELVLTEDRARAQQLAQELDLVNRERRRVELDIRLQAEAQIDGLGPRAAYVLAQDGWHPGVVGIVASRLAERHRRPVVLIALDGEAGRGSGRSGTEAFDLLAGLTACASELVSYGGHRAAAGVAIERARLGVFATAFEAHVAHALAGEDAAVVERVDAVVAGDELGMGLAEELQLLAPFGHGNPSVSLLLTDAVFTEVRSMGEGRHARFTVRSHDASARAVAFNTGRRLPVAEGEAVEATFTLEVNEFKGVTEPRLVLRHARPARVEIEAERGRQESDEELVLFALP